MSQEEQKDYKWYSIRTYVGQEKKAKQAILNLVEDANLQDNVLEILVPTGDVLKRDKKSGKKRIAEELLYSGYVFANLHLDSSNLLVSKIQSLPGISGFVGGASGPTALSQKDINIILDRVYNRPPPRSEYDFSEGEMVKIVEGQYKSFKGYIEDYDMYSGKVKVRIRILGRDEIVELLDTDVTKNIDEE